MPLLPPREMKMSSAEPSVRTKWGRCWGAVRAPRIPGQQRPLLRVLSAPTPAQLSLGVAGSIINTTPPKMQEGSWGRQAVARGTSNRREGWLLSQSYCNGFSRFTKRIVHTSTQLPSNGDTFHFGQDQHPPSQSHRNSPVAAQDTQQSKRQQGI